MASTLGSAAAASMSRSTLVVNDSYGWCTRTSRSRRAAKMSVSFGMADEEGTNGG